MQNLLRQIKDIQQQATLLLVKEEVTPEEIKLFHQYSTAIKASINETTNDSLIRSLVNEIPGEELIRVALNAERTGFWDFDLIGLFKSGESRTAKDLIRIISSKYAATEMLLSNQIDKSTHHQINNKKSPATNFTGLSFNNLSNKK